MFGFRFIKGAAIGLAAFGLVVPEVRLLADAPQANPPAIKSNRTNRIPDLILTDGGTVTGRVCDHTGKVLPGMVVELKQFNKTLSTATTNKDGIYSFSNIKGGVYHMSCGNTEGIFRIWSEKAAPPTAKGHALLVMGENGARGQFGSIDPMLLLLTAGVLASVVVSAITLNKIDSLTNRVDQLSVSPVSP